MWSAQKNRFLLVAALVVLSVTLSTSVLHSQDKPDDWKADWEIEEGFAIDIDTLGYTLPSAIAVVPNPGNAPEAPLYFVTELEGKVKVVTNDRTVHTFADLQLVLPDAPLKGEAGMAGICLAPERGYIFVTFTSADDEGILSNNILRFETRPRIFSVMPHDQLLITEVFAGHRTVGSHQIGGCQVQNDFLYVSVGDGALMPETAQDLNSPLGKVLRMTLDGKPARGNPFYANDSASNPRNFIWAYGFKNPFGIKATNGRLFSADNGNSIDRFVEIKKGQNYLWDSTDQSVAAKAAAVIFPSGGVVQMDYYPESLTLFPEEFRDRFYLTISRGAAAGVLTIDYSFEESQVKTVPKYFLRIGRTQLIAGLAFGQDGLYVVPLRPIKDSESGVLKITYDPSREHPYRLIHADGNELMFRKGCTGCHVIPSAYYGEEFIGRPEIGPSLERDALVSRLSNRLNSQEYLRTVEALDKLNTEPFISFRQARQEVLAAEGEEKVRTWLEYRIQEPRFDNPNSLMPNLGVSAGDASLIADALLQGVRTDQSLLERTKRLLLPEELRRLHLVQYFAAGFFFGGVVFTISILVSLRLYRLIRPRN